MKSSQPFWPRMLRKATAASYLDISVSEFDREVAAQRLPLPVKLGNGEHWSRAALDEAVERLSGERASDWREQSKLYGDRAA